MSKIRKIAQRTTKMKTLVDHPDVVDVVGTEEFIMPHKQAGLCPHDVVICFEQDETGQWVEESVRKLLEARDAVYDRVVGVGDSRGGEQGDRIAYISLSDYGATTDDDTDHPVGADKSDGNLLE